MNISTIAGLVVAFGGIIVGYLLEGGELSALIALSPALIVFGGTFGATFMSNQGLTIKSMGKTALSALKPPAITKIKDIEASLVEMAEISRTKGILSLEEYIRSHEELDDVLKRGAMLLLDGYNSEQIEETMYEEVALIEKTKHAEASVWEAMAGYGPTMGVLGTVMGLIHTLGNMGSPDELTHSIASAFIATMYGVGVANILFMPIGNKAKLNIKLEGIMYEMQIQGIISIQKGMNPRTLRERLVPYLEAVGVKSDADASEG
jgi:chemotaxis protein MotA